MLAVVLCDSCGSLLAEVLCVSGGSLLAEVLCVSCGSVCWGIALQCSDKLSWGFTAPSLVMVLFSTLSVGCNKKNEVSVLQVYC